MARPKARSILQRQLDTRRKLWPALDRRSLWTTESDGWVPTPRLMPLIMSIMDDMAGKGVPVSRTYLELWSRVRVEESFIALNRPEEMAFHAGFEGQRALRTWKDRMHRLAALGFIDIKAGPLGELSYALILNPFHVLKRAQLAGSIQDAKWQALIVRANEVGASDIDELDDTGKFVEDEDDEDEDEDNDEERPAPKKSPVKLKPAAKRSRRVARGAQRPQAARK